MSLDYFRKMFRKYRDIGILIDTNLILVYLLGRIDPGFISTNERTKTYREVDFRILEGIIKNTNKIIVSSYILTEVSNLSKIRRHNLREYYEEFTKYIITSSEDSPPTQTLISKETQDTLLKFGLTDLSIIETLRINNYLLLSADFKLCSKVLDLGYDAINYTNIQTYNWLD